MVAYIFIGVAVAAGVVVTRRLGRSGDPMATYSPTDQDAIRRMRVRDKKSPPA